MLNIITRFLISLIILTIITVNANATEAKGIPKVLIPAYQLALEGNVFAQERIGEMYHYGQGVDKNFENAFHWYELAANQESASAQDSLGLFYAGGIGINKDCGKSIAWFRKAYANGFQQSKGNIVWMLATCEDASKRNGDLALSLAKEDIKENGRDIRRLDNLAAAFAEMSDFKNAVKTQEEVIFKLKNSYGAEDLADYQERLETYKNNKPWRGASYESPEDYTY